MALPKPPTPSRSRSRARTRTRGAVMVEAALVMPLLVVFLGLNIFFHRAYKEKIRIRSEAREAAFDAASRACRSGSASTESSLQTGTSAGATEVGRTAQQRGDGTASVMSFEHGTAKASKSATVSWKTAYGPWTKTLKPAESYVYCNEKGVSTNPASWFSWGTSEFKKH